MIEIIDKKNCCGCTACMNSCPKNAITMVEDSEGFKYPHISSELCINCNLCEKVCPIINPLKEEKKEQIAYIVQNKDLKILSESTSGGAFTAIAEYVISQSGIVFGVTMVDYVAFHCKAESLKELKAFRSSKYIQSDLNFTFKEVKQNLDNKRMVLFSGTGCQIEGLLSYLRFKNYNNLILVDVVCRAVPSPKVFRKYMEYKEEQFGKNLNVRFRDKNIYGYNYSNLSIKNDSKTIYHAGVDNDEFLRLFFQGYCNRPSCSDCKFRKEHRYSDFTIWDCFDIRNFSKKLNNNLGATKVLIHSEKGKSVFESIKDKFNYIEVDPSSITSKEMLESVSDNIRRDEFMKALNSLTNQELFKKYCPSSFKLKCIHFVKIILIKTHIYSILKALKLKK